jgi:hypothetical protein
MIVVLFSFDQFISKGKKKGRELNGREKERERGERCGCGSNYGDGVGL